jgi:hypothetical protein
MDDNDEDWMFSYPGLAVNPSTEFKHEKENGAVPYPCGITPPTTGNGNRTMNRSYQDNCLFYSARKERATPNA